MRLCLAALFAAVLPHVLPQAALATDPPLQMLESSLQVQGWEGVGRIDVGGRGFCTGALISQRLVLTAAHCLFDKESGARVPDGDLVFRAGWRNGRAAAEGQVQRSAIHPRYTPEQGTDIDNVAHDLALLELSHPIRNLGVTPFEVYAEPRGGDQVGVVSYARGRSEVPALQERCQVIERDRSGVLMLSCNVDFGASGAPVFAISEGRAQIVSVVSAMGRGNVDGAQRQVSLGVSLGTRLEELRAALDTSDRRFVRAPGPGSDAPREMSSGGGARFLRP